MAERRKTPYTKEEMLKVVNDRKAHPEMGAMEWAKQYPITPATYYVFLKRLGLGTDGKKAKPEKTVKAKQPKAVAKKAKQPRSAKVLAKVKTGGLIHAMMQAKHWREEVERHSAGMSVSDLRAVIEGLVG
jgi:hypothetical protein